MKYLFIFICLACLTLTSAQDNADKWSLNFSISTVSRYLWRGQNLHNGFALQPGIDFETGKWTTSLWASQNFGDRPTKGFAEVDYTSGFAVPCPFWEKCEISSGFILYLYPQSFGTYNEEFSMEGFLGLSLDLITAPALTYYFDAKYGQYFELGLSHELEISETFKITPSLTSGLGLTQDTTAEWTATPSVVAPCAVFDYSTAVDLSLTLAGQFPLHDDYKRDFYAGIAVSYSLVPKK